MSSITTQIEQALQAIDQATFQKLMNYLLYYEGLKFIGSPGSVLGKDKTSKGSPDSFFEDEENYIFLECTTQEKLGNSSTLLNKLEKDIAHCFDESKTKVSKKAISKIILAFTEKINTSEHEQLKKAVSAHNAYTQLIIYSGQELPFKILRYPNLADNFLGVNSTKGTIYSLPDFLSKTEKGIQPSLTNTFVGREQEIKEINEILNEEDILILSGAAGVGKSKISVEVAKEFERKATHQIFVIEGSPVPMWDDFNNFIVPDKNYLILFDDANKAIPNLEYLLSYIKSKDKGTIKVLITVRDYVKKDIAPKLLDTRYREYEIKKLDNKQIKEILDLAMPPDWRLTQEASERIVSFSKGNARMALMALDSVLNKDEYKPLENPYSVYNDYFEKIEDEKSILRDKKRLIALGITSFFGVLDRNNSQLAEELKENFNIDWVELWETLLELEKDELVDVYTNEVAKISDQLLSVFVFFKAFIDKETSIIPYYEWTKHFIVNNSSRVRKSIVEVMNTFTPSFVEEYIIDDLRKILTDLNDEKELFNFYTIFWILFEEDTILFIKKWADNLETQVTDIEKIEFDTDNNDLLNSFESLDYFELIDNFWRLNSPYTSSLIEIGLEVIIKQPLKASEVLKHFSDNLSYGRYDARLDYEKQHTFFDILINQSDNQNLNTIKNKIFLSIAKNFISWEYHQTESGEGASIVFYNFGLVKTDSLLKLREKIILHLFTFLPTNESEVFDFLEKYAWGGINFDKSVYLDEKPVLLKFIKDNLNTSNFKHCSWVYEYYKTLKEVGENVEAELKYFINNEQIELAKLLIYDFDEELSENYETREEKVKERIRNYIKGKEKNEIITVLQKVAEIQGKFQGRDNWKFDDGLPYLYIVLAEEEPSLYFEAIQFAKEPNNNIRIVRGTIISNPLRSQHVSASELYKLINSGNYPLKQSWKHLFFEVLLEEDVSSFFFDEFIEFMNSFTEPLWFMPFEKYVKFNTHFQDSALDKGEHQNIITYLAEILINKSKDVKISFDFEFCQRNQSYFKNHLPLLKQIFFYCEEKDNHYDHSGRETKAISDLDNYFPLEFLEVKTKGANYIENTRLKKDIVNTNFIWDYDEYEKIIGGILEIFIKKASYWRSFEHIASGYFKDALRTEGREEKVFGFISKYIATHHSSKEHMGVIFNIIAYNFRNKIFDFLRELLILNKDVEMFKSLELRSNGVISGSRVPSIDADITFNNKLIDLAKSMPQPLDYIDHIKMWEEGIVWLKKSKKDELKNDFIGFYN